MILEDVALLGGVLQSADTQTVELRLEDALTPNTQYSLLALSGAEGSLDFRTPAGVEGFIANNFTSMKSDDIDSIEILDDRTMIVSFRQQLTSIDYDFKLFAELDITEVRKDDIQLPVLSIETHTSLKSETNYLLMFIDMFNADGRMIDFDTGIYDFTTPEFEIDDMVSIETDASMYLDEYLEEDDIRALEQDIIEAEIPLEAAPELEDSNLEELALDADRTPDTGAPILILLLITLIANIILFGSRLKKILFAS